MILLAIVVVVGLFVSTVARLVILAKGVDAGTANLVFLIIVVKTVAGMVKIDIYCDGNMEVRETINCLESRSIHLLYQKVLKLFMEVTDEQ